MAKKVILCVDDEKIILNSLKTQLKGKFGTQYMYETAENSEEALEVIDELEEEGCDILLIVSDWLMPGMKGDAFLIQVHRKYPDIVTVMLTGQADADAVENAKKEANLHRCLRKPWSEAELVDTIKTGIGEL